MPARCHAGFGYIYPYRRKVAYLNQLLKVGFDTIDFGSFVSPKAIPQMRDTAEVLEQLDLSTTSSKLVGYCSKRARCGRACKFEAIRFSVSHFPFQKLFSNAIPINQ
jgi:hydroxymethylglutaryl-CoA lyase